VQLTTDGHKPYFMAVEGPFGAGIDYAPLTKIYGNDSEGEKRYSPAKCLGVNFARVHQTIRVTPAMEAGVSDHVWSIEEIGLLLD
jgi:hypothetical protein